jgi:hypothetical protein
MPGRLRALRQLMGARAHAREHGGEVDAGKPQHFSERRGVRTVRLLPRHLRNECAGCGGRCHQHARRGLECLKPARQPHAFNGEGQRPRGIQHDDACARRRAREGAQQIPEPNGVERDIGVAFKSRIGGDQKIVAVIREAIAREVNERDRVRTGGFDLAQKRPKLTHEIGLAKIGAFNDLKSDGAQRLGHQTGIVERGRQRAACVAAIPDNKSNPRLDRLRPPQRRRPNDQRQRHQRGPNNFHRNLPRSP